MLDKTFYSVEWEDGPEGVQEKLLKVKQEFESAFEIILMQAGLVMQGYVQDQIEAEGLVVTGYLKANWVTFLREKIKNEYYEIVVATNTHYAPYLEWGTIDDKGKTIIKARKFMDKAWYQHGDKIKLFIREEVQALI